VCAAWTRFSRGLAEAAVAWKQRNDTLPYLERRAYLGAIQDAVAGVGEARVVLAKARQGLERDCGPGTASRA
jgi:hypothetical protein